MSKKIEPNYERMLQARISVAQNAYEEYKKAAHELIDATWLGNDGTFWMHGLEEAHKKVEETTKIFEDAFNEMIKFRKTAESVKGDKNEY